jgi:hypothetical protein
VPKLIISHDAIICNYLHCFVINSVKHALIGLASISRNQWNALSWVQQKLAWSAKGEFKETPLIVTLGLRRCNTCCSLQIVGIFQSSRLCISALIGWCISALIGWCISVLIGWCISVLTGWCIGALIGWCIGALIGWCISALIGWWGTSSSVAVETDSRSTCSAAVLVCKHLWLLVTASSILAGFCVSSYDCSVADGPVHHPSGL